MKKILCWSLLALMSAGAAVAKKNVRPAQPAPAQTGVFPMREVQTETADLQELLELKGMYIRKYDLSGIRDTTLRVVVQIDEYFGRDSVRPVRKIVLGDIWSQRDSSYVKSLKFLIVPKTDSTAMFYCDLEDRGQRGELLKFNRAKPDFKKFNSYRPRPFKFEGLEAGKVVPVMLFGAFWYDAELSERYHASLYRFCMENEMAADMHNQAFDNMPHYWVIRVGLEKR
ncbi:DUF5041 domain-containing protein [uncultured Rikenella sp.]|uniref:DUF5041 domain-containing protein n=1 Tax=uncultured Rikenella sp. TaxID=368003 RepID=UPI00261E6F6F|nr:DUF5041 domain-containing protein [uncultured Rikenella sp.]